MTAQIKILKNTSDARIAYVNNRAVSTIIKIENGNYRVVKLYEGFASASGASIEAPTSEQDA